MGTQEAPILRSLLSYLSKALPGKDDELPFSLKAHIYPVPLLSSLSEYHPLYTTCIQESCSPHVKVKLQKNKTHCWVFPTPTSPPCRYMLSPGDA